MTSSGNAPYKIEYDERVLKDDVPRLSKPALKLIQKAIEQRLATNPIQYGKPLRHSLSGLRRIRVSDYRIIYKISATDHTVTIRAIGHRKHVYH